MEEDVDGPQTAVPLLQLGVGGRDGRRRGENPAVDLRMERAETITAASTAQARPLPP